MTEFWQEELQKSLGTGAVGYALVLFDSGTMRKVEAGRAGDARGKAPPMTSETLLHTASTAKPITATALLKALHDKGLDETARLGRFLPENAASPSVRSLTIEDLLTHRTGMPFAYVRGEREEALRPFLMRELPAAERREVAYSNVNFAIARDLIERISGRTYQAFVEEEIFRPAGIVGAATRPRQAGSTTPFFAIGDPEGERVENDFGAEAGPYGWYLTTRDLALFAKAVSEERILPKAVKDRMLRKKLGWYEYFIGTGSAYGHNGLWIAHQNRGGATALMIFPDGDVAALAVNTNVGGMDLAKIYSAGTPVIRSWRAPRIGRTFAQIEVPPAADEVFYSLDGSTPTRRSPRYTAPFEIAAPATIRAIAYRRRQPISTVQELQLPAPKASEG